MIMTSLSPGIDIIDIGKFELTLKSHGEKFLGKIFGEEELRYCYKRKFPCMHLAARFAVKEAVKKSFGLLGIFVKFSDIRVQNRPDGYPELDLKKLAKYLPEEIRNFDLKISISHTKELACAFSVLSFEKRKT